MIYGWQDNKYIHIKKVLRGKKCDCLCVECQAPLVAKQGRVNEWHFAHASDTSCGGYNPETLLHKRAKEALAEVIRTRMDYDPTYPVLVEQNYPNSKFRSDVSYKDMYFELTVTHPIDANKYHFLSTSFPGTVYEINLNRIDREKEDLVSAIRSIPWKKIEKVKKVINLEEEFWNYGEQLCKEFKKDKKTFQNNLLCKPELIPYYNMKYLPSNIKRRWTSNVRALIAATEGHNIGFAGLSIRCYPKNFSPIATLIALCMNNRYVAIAAGCSNIKWALDSIQGNYNTKETWLAKAVAKHEQYQKQERKLEEWGKKWDRLRNN